MRSSKILGILAFFLFSVCNIHAEDWNVSLIPDSLKDGGQVSVVRLYDVSYKAKNESEGVCYYRSVVTVLNKRGDDLGGWHEITEKGREELVNFSGNVYDAQGNLVRKIKKDEIRFSKYSDNLSMATNVQRNRVSSPTGIDYPYTVEYKWELKYSNGIFSYPTYFPVDEYQSFQEGLYFLRLNAGTKIATDVLNLSTKCEKSKEGEFDVYKWHVPARRAVISDSFEPHMFYSMPRIMAHPLQFSYGKYAGRLDNWESLGDWSAELAKGRDVLPQAEKDKVHSLTDNLSTNKEKIEALYKYLGQRTRYVAINLGIGGWQPMKAEEVSKTGFGDCKALSNFMHSMLKEIGIKSHLTLISTKHENLLPGFPNFNQLDHVILCVPEADTLWIDCTAADHYPFGIVPSSLRGNECVLVKEEGSELARIPAMTTNENKYVINVDVTLDDKFAIKNAHYSSKLYGRFYNKSLDLCDKDAKTKTDVLSDVIDLGNSKLSNVKVSNSCDSVPFVKMECDFTATYGRKTGTRFFMPANPFTEVSKITFREGRVNPIVVDVPKTFQDMIEIHMPANTSNEGMPEPKMFKNEFGAIISLCSLVNENTLMISQTTVINAGTFPIEKKEQFLDFHDMVNKCYRAMIVLKKN